MKKYFRKRDIVFLAFSLVYIFQLNKVCTNYNRYDRIINEDALGYYVILPAFFEYSDPEFAFFDSTLRKTDKYKNYIPPVINTLKDGEKVCKYYSGVAMLQSPFYLCGRIVAKINDQNSGFEPIYHYSILISVVFYLLCGFYLLLKSLLKINCPLWLSVLLMAFCLYGTNLFAYSTYDPAYSHVYSFFALNLFVYSLLRLKSDISVKSALISGLAFGIIVMIRPLNGICILFLPIVLGTQNLKTLFSRQYFYCSMIGLTAFLTVCSVQVLLWYWQSGHLFVYPYGEEKLNLFQGRMIELMFSYNCGWVLYTPLPFFMLMLAIVLLFLKKKLRQALWLSFSAAVIIYLLSCWYYLHYGCTVGCRPITEFYGPLTLVYGLSVLPFIHSRWFRFLVLPLMFVLSVYNQIIHFQFFNQIINWCDMDKKRFHMVFLKTAPEYSYACSPFWDFSGFGKQNPLDTLYPEIKLNIDKGKEIDSITYHLPPAESNDSSLLLRIKTDGKMIDKVNDSYLRILVTDSGRYVELLNLLLMRKIEEADQNTEFIYEFNVNRSLKNAKLHLSLESVGDKAETELFIKSLEISRIAL